MLERSSYPKLKDVMLINDVPVIAETENGEKFSSMSNGSLLTSLRTGRVASFNANAIEGFNGINSLDIYTTYVDYTYYGGITGNFDYVKEVVKSKDINANMGVFRHTETGKGFRKLPTHKDIFVSERLWSEFKGLLKEIELVKPKLVIVTGKWGLFFLSGKVGLGETQGNFKDRRPLGSLVKYRSSLLSLHQAYMWEGIADFILIPIWHTVHANGMPDKIPVMCLDIQKLGHIYETIKEKGVSYYKVPLKETVLCITKEIAIKELNFLLSKLDSSPNGLFISIDIETMYRMVIDCIGLAISKDKGICIPFATVDNPVYWSLEDETEIMLLLKQVLEHPNGRHVGQNYSYDCQYMSKKWLIEAKPFHDTMVLHHILYNYLPKDLAFLASLYCEFYSYWKDEIDATKETPETRWSYNVKDILYTFEVLEVLLNTLAGEPKELKELYEFQILELAPELDITMNFGVAVDREQKEELFNFFKGVIDKVKLSVNDILGFDFNVNSTPQKKKLFSDFLGITLKTKKKKGGSYVETCDGAAVLAYIEEYPIHRPLLGLLLELSAVSKFTNTFLGMKLDDDGRMRTQYKIAGTTTGRLASVINVWGNGGNLMNLPTSGKLPIHYSLQVINENILSNDSVEEWEEFLNKVEESEEVIYE